MNCFRIVTLIDVLLLFFKLFTLYKTLYLLFKTTKMKKILLPLLLFILNFCSAQVVINEVDADNPGSDVREFVELKSTVANFSLNGYVLVFFNGTSTGLTKTSYLTIDLDGFTTDINGIIHFGNLDVTPAPAGLISSNSIQNGPDGIGLYIGNAVDFPFGTLATGTNLIDGIAYTGTATQATAIMAAFNITACTLDVQSSNSISKSIQRRIDGSYELKAPTPGANNDGSGIVINYITTTLNATSVTEGQNLIVTIATASAVQNASLTVNIDLSNFNFTSSDYSGSATISIPVGATSNSASYQIINDGINDGDKELKVNLSGYPSNYALFNNNIVIRVDDINFLTANYGIPTNPTYGNVVSTAPTNYYSSLEGLSGNALKQGVQNIIADPNTVHAHNYGDIIDILKVADQNPQNSNKVWLMYVEQSRAKIDFQETSSNIGKWTREHIYPQSRGGFADATSGTPDGISVWLPTNANDIAAGHADAHHLRAEDGAENSARSNRNYGVDYNGPQGNVGSWKGDVARSLFYMAVRYNGLNIVNGNPSDSPTTTGSIGDLASLLAWNVSDPRDDFEMNRNNYIYTWQVNRNPFIDYPNLANYIFGSNFGQAWSATLANTNFDTLKNIFTVYPNPAKETLFISGTEYGASIKLYSSLGVKLIELSHFSDQTAIDVSMLSTGIYLLKIQYQNGVFEQKVIID